MAPPPITPSPHRFLPNPTPLPASKPASRLPTHQRRSEAPSPQFASPPRFAAKKDLDLRPETATSPLVSRIRHPARRREDIEDNPPDVEDYPPDDHDAVIPPATTNTPHHAGPYTARPRKRLRQTLPPHHALPPRFLPTPTPTPASPSRPSFLLPTPPVPTTPTLPSPHRRGQKFEPGGLAATVRDWVVERSTSGMGGEGDERVRVGDVRVGGGGGTWLVRETGGDGEGRRWVLVGNGNGGEVGVGRVVRVKGPVWEVRVAGGAVWRVGVSGGGRGGT